jgi:excisionase family DNA binding protein
VTDEMPQAISMAQEFPGWQIGPLPGRGSVWEAYWRSPDGRQRRAILALSAPGLRRRLRAAHGEIPALLRPAEAASALGVHAQTVVRWAAKGYLTAVRTPSGHRRYLAAQVATLLRGGPAPGGVVMAVQPCPRCGGSGSVADPRGPRGWLMTCPQCGGRGTIGSK